MTLLGRQAAGHAFTRTAEPVTVGVPLPKSWCRNLEDLSLSSEGGAHVALQTRALDRWADGSIRWVLLDFKADVPARATQTYRLSPTGPVAIPDVELRVEVLNGEASVDTGPAHFIVRSDGSLECRLTAEAGEPPAVSRLEIRDSDGTMMPIAVTRILLEEGGPLRSVVLVEGSAFSGGGRNALRITLRHHFYSGISSVRTWLTLRNTRRAAHRGGHWDLGDPASVYLKDLSIVIQPPAVGRWDPFCSPESPEPIEEFPGPFELYQDSSGGENWKSLNHVDRQRTVPASFRGYRLRSPAGERRGYRASPVAGLRCGGREVGVALRHFWQRFPKAVEATSAGLVLRLLPGRQSVLHEIQPGEQLTEEFAVSFARDTVSGTPLDWVRDPLVAHCEPAWYVRSEAMPHLAPAGADQTAYRALVNAAIEGSDTFEAKRERVDEYGWRHFGDIYADHEAVGHAGPHPLVSHYNNQYDAIAGLTCQFFRSGDLRWWSLVEELARHVIDIDIYHTADDKAAYNGGLFWHTHHYTDADLSTHRTYPSICRHGGGPSGEHNYNTGLMLYYFMTGDPRAREAAVDLGRWVIDMDDGRLTPFRWLSRRPTGLASATGSSTYHGPGRGPGNSLAALLNAFRLSGDRTYVVMAERLVRRCIHPDDDIARLNLLDAERRWYYTVFLQALGRYLDFKADIGELDRMYVYARMALLHYARWMAAHEYPYLEKPEILEYPNETWAAQDMRKCEVFLYAAKHATSKERAVFLDRADFFFTYSVSTLSTMETRTLARPVVLMLSNGGMHSYFQQRPGIAAPAAPEMLTDFGRPEVFIPQKVQAVTRALVVIGVAAAACLAGLVMLLLR